MIYYLQENYCIDNNRLYATGFDIGGGFIDDIACSKDTGDYFAAFAMVSPALIGKGLYQKHRAPHCSPSRPHPMLQSQFALLGRKLKLLNSPQYILRMIKTTTTWLARPKTKLA